MLSEERRSNFEDDENDEPEDPFEQPKKEALNKKANIDGLDMKNLIKKIKRR